MKNQPHSEYKDDFKERFEVIDYINEEITPQPFPGAHFKQFAKVSASEVLGTFDPLYELMKGKKEIYIPIIDVDAIYRLEGINEMEEDDTD